MGHKNYSNFSKHFNKKQNNVETENKPMEGQVAVEDIITPVEFPIVEDLKLQEGDIVTEEGIIQADTPKTVTGIVTGCEKLYVRTKPSKESNHITIIPKETEIQINLSESTEDFYKVTTSMGIEGYCMKKFITIK